jgi:hypothetical protein
VESAQADFEFWLPRIHSPATGAALFLIRKLPHQEKGGKGSGTGTGPHENATGSLRCESREPVGVFLAIYRYGPRCHAPETAACVDDANRFGKLIAFSHLHDRARIHIYVDPRFDNFAGTIFANVHVEDSWHEPVLLSTRLRSCGSHARRRGLARSRMETITLIILPIDAFSSQSEA